MAEFSGTPRGEGRRLAVVGSRFNGEITAKLVEGGTWRTRVVFREALADAGRMRLALGGHLAKLPAPAREGAAAWIAISAISAAPGSGLMWVSARK